MASLPRLSFVDLHRRAWIFEYILIGTGCGIIRFSSNLGLVVFVASIGILIEEYELDSCIQSNESRKEHFVIISFTDAYKYRKRFNLAPPHFEVNKLR